MSTTTRRKKSPKAKALAAERLRKARLVNIPEFRDRIQSYLEDDIDDSAEPIRCHDLQHFVRHFKSAPNVMESSYRECRVCANDMIQRVLRARDSDLAVVRSWDGQCRMTITSTPKEFGALKRKINRHKVPYFFVHVEGHSVVISHPDSDLGGVLYDTHESSLDMLNMVYSQLVDPSMGGSLTTSGRKYGACSRDVLPVGTTDPTPTSETSNIPPVETPSTETPSVVPDVPQTPTVPPVPASMNPDDWTTGDDYQPDPTEMTDEELYTSRMRENDTPYSKLPRDVRRALDDSRIKRTTPWHKCPKGYMELARTHEAEYFVIQGKQWTWIPLKRWEEFKKALAVYKPEKSQRQPSYA